MSDVEIVTVACRTDNYAFLVHTGGMTALVDAPEAQPILDALDAKGWALDEVWITHHHADHVDGLDGLRATYPDLEVTGAKADAHRLPKLDREVAEGDAFQFDGQAVEVLDVSGHTVGHIAFHMPGARAAFTADSLMALGCGRLFEGSPEMMWASMQKLAALPEDTVVYSGHEYTQTNAKFALTIEPDNVALAARADAVSQARSNGAYTVPSTLADEKATNPFLRAHLREVKEAISMPLADEKATNPFLRAHLREVKEAISMPQADDISVFAEIRARKDAF